MKVILQQEVKKVGKKGDIIEVSEGYARNFLLPKGLALEATSANINMLKQQKASEALKQQKLLEEAKALGEKVKGAAVTIKAKIGEGGRMFGSVTGKDVADALEKQHKLSLDKRKIELKDAIKSLGEYTVPVKIHTEVTVDLQVKVVPE
ncbi:MAG TPA: 50S ribosomal protein L9 [Firmicutes bacterium]|nr:50S ribosomal protein L9 [Bacillota bacterium]HWR56573.1 50S ribosomal protein L9 [Negativicutes bacterium]